MTPPHIPTNCFVPPFGVNNWNWSWSPAPLGLHWSPTWTSHHGRLQRRPIYCEIASFIRNNHLKSTINQSINCIHLSLYPSSPWPRWGQMNPCQYFVETTQASTSMLTCVEGAKQISICLPCQFFRSQLACTMKQTALVQLLSGFTKSPPREGGKFWWPRSHAIVRTPLFLIALLQQVACSTTQASLAQFLLSTSTVQ